MSAPRAAALAVDLLCIHCGYNLRTLEPSGRCPECGRSVLDSMVAGSLHVATPSSLRYLALATFLMPAGTLLACVGCLIIAPRHALSYITVTTLHPLASGGFNVLLLGDASALRFSSFGILILVGMSMRLAGLFILSINHPITRTSARTPRLLLRCILAATIAASMTPVYFEYRPSSWDPSVLYLSLIAALAVDAIVVEISTRILLSITQANWGRANILLDLSRFFAHIAAMGAIISIICYYWLFDDGAIPAFGILAIFSMMLATPSYIAACLISHVTLFYFTAAFTRLAMRRGR